MGGLGALPFAVAKGLRGTFVPLGRTLLVCHSQPARCLALQTHLVATADTGSGEAVMKFSLEITPVLI